MADEVLAFDKWVEEMGWAAKWTAEGEDRGKAKWTQPRARPRAKNSPGKRS